MALESVLRGSGEWQPGPRSRDVPRGDIRDPVDRETWGWSFEGHHLSVNLTLVEGQRFAVTPSFFGSNPAIVPSGPQQGQQVLAAEQELARELMRSLSPPQRTLAIIAKEAPSDIITGADRKVGVIALERRKVFRSNNSTQPSRHCS